MHFVTRPVRLVIVLMAAVWCATLAMGSGVVGAGASARAGTPPTSQESVGQPAAGYVGQQVCVTCHSDTAEALSHTAHGRSQDPRSPASTQGCEACHGAGREHADSGGDPTKIRQIALLPARDASGTCTSCHNRGSHAQWSGSTHDIRNVSCVTCHSVHTPKSESGQLIKATQTETCVTCHQSQVLKMQRASHMPVREGKMECSSCHNPHGATNVRLLKAGNWVNESCVSCHAEKRGPFLWEHAAGRESCVTCHDPHGASNDRLLVAKLPMLCQRCHIGTRHPSTIYDNTARATSNRLYGRSCVTCHQNIHGSNHPSGNAFLR